jgi:hypothetical protein
MSGHSGRILVVEEELLAGLDVDFGVESDTEARVAEKKLRYAVSMSVIRVIDEPELVAHIGGVDFLPLFSLARLLM